MSAIIKLISKLGNKSIGAVALIVSCLIAAAGFMWQQQATDKQFEQQQQAYQNQTATLLNEVTTLRIQNLKAKMQVVASLPQLATIVVEQNNAQIEGEQQALMGLFPNAEKVCLISADVNNVDESACIPITFSVLSSLRKAKQQDGASIGVMQVGTDNAYVLLTQQITNTSKQVVGVLAVALKSDVVAAELFSVPGFEGYAELRQGTKKSATIASMGDAQWKVGAAQEVMIMNTHWKIAYWKPSDTTLVSSTLVMAIVVGIIALMWLFQRLVEGYFFRKDIKVVRQQLVDVKLGTLKPKYHVTGRAFQEVVDDIKNVALSMASASAVTAVDDSGEVKESTSARISKRIEERESIEQPVAEEMINDYEPEPVDIDVAIDPSIFKAYDIRGIAGQVITDEVAQVLGQAIGSEALDEGVTDLVVGRDGRNSSPALSEALISGILASGCNVVDVGMVTTPVLYFAAEHAESKSGIMVTGSHNPANYNGFKIVLAGQALLGEELKGIHQRIVGNTLRSGQGTHQEMDVIDEYISRITGDVKLPRPVKVVIDSGNGVAGLVAPKLFKALGCDVIELYSDVNGDFPNHQPDPSQPDNLEALISEVAKNEAELGLAFDGDGDRLGVVDAEGNIIWTDRLMSMFAQDILLRMPGSVIIYDVKSSNLLGEEISRSGGEAVMWRSGHSVIRNKMQELDAQLAGELSGHIFFKDRWFGFDDAAYAASRLLELLCNDPLERTPTDIFSALPSRVSTSEILVEMSDRESREFIARLEKEAEFSGAEITTIDGVRADYPNGWGLVRASNTMPGLTLRFEADTLNVLQHIQQHFKQQMLQIKPTLILSFLTLDKK